MNTNEQGPCGKICDDCLVDPCPITQEQWNDWLTADMRNPILMDDALRADRKVYYDDYSDEYGFLMTWMEELLTERSSEEKRTDFFFRYPMKGSELRSFLNNIIKETLTYREQHIVYLHLSLEKVEKYSLKDIAELFDLRYNKVRETYLGALEKLRKAILERPEWRTDRCQPTDQTTTTED